MANEIRIIVKAYDETAAGYAKARSAANKTASDIEGEMKSAGQKGGKALGDGIAAGAHEGSRRGKSEFSKLTDDGGGGGFGSKIKSAITKGMSSGFLEAIPAAVPVLAGLSPLIGAVASAGIIGGVGLGGILGGVALAAQDPAIKDAGKTLGKNMLSSLQDDSKVFTQPITDSIKIIGDSFEKDLQPRFANIFKNSAAFLAPLTADISEMIGHITRGIDAIIGKAGPVMSSLGTLFDETGDAIGDMFETIAGGSDDAAKGLDTLTFVLGGVIRGTGYLIRGLTEVFGAINTGAEGLVSFSNWLSQDYPEAAGAFEAHTASAANGATTFGQELEIARSRAVGLGGPITTLTDQINGFSDASRSAFGAATNLGEALLSAKESFDKNGHSIATNTKAGLANRAALSQVADAMKGAYNAQVALTGEGDKASDVANKNRRDFIKLAREGLGLAKGAAEDLADELGLIKAPKPIKININADEQRNKLRTLQAQINAMHGKTIPITVRITTKGETLYGNQAPQMAHGGIKGAASGMNTSGLTWVGEHGPELVSLPAGSTVRSNPDSQRMAKQIGGGSNASGPLEITLRFDPSGSPRAIAGMMEGLRAEISNQGGSVQTVLGVAGVN